MTATAEQALAEVWQGGNPGTLPEGAEIVSTKPRKRKDGTTPPAKQRVAFKSLTGLTAHYGDAAVLGVVNRKLAAISAKSGIEAALSWKPAAGSKRKGSGLRDLLKAAEAKVGKDELRNFLAQIGK